MKQDPRTIINTNEDHTYNKPADKKVTPRTLEVQFTFGITNNSDNTAVVNYGYTKL